MACEPKKEINRLPGYAVLSVAGVATPDVLAGQLVRLIDSATITIADGSLSDASNSVLGIAADTTAQYSASQYLTTTDSYAKGNKVGVFIDGGVFEVYNDGRGIVFAADCVNADPGAPLYVDASGNWTTMAGSASTVGATVLGHVLSAPTSISGVLKLHLVA